METLNVLAALLKTYGAGHGLHRFSVKSEFIPAQYEGISGGASAVSRADMARQCLNCASNRSAHVRYGV